jgi:hypothetical protein
MHDQTRFCKRTFSGQNRNNSQTNKTKTNRLMTIIEIWPNKFSNQNFVNQGLPAKRQMVPFRLISLKYLRKNSYLEQFVGVVVAHVLWLMVRFNGKNFLQCKIKAAIVRKPRARSASCEGAAQAARAKPELTFCPNKAAPGCPDR